MLTPFDVMVSNLLTSAIFIVLGYFITRKRLPPQSPYAWLALVLALFLSGWVGTSGLLVSVPGFRMYINVALQALFAGVLIGYLVRKPA
ncbi:MAG: hypothetical protein HGA86_06110 [Anaerolineaceae bacterium]|nr:hypothetical protein [Anaerolineaceae bacterium]